MDKFNSLDALVAESKKEFHMLIKFGSLENLERFQGGSLYMKNLRFYNELECEPGKARQIRWEMENEWGAVRSYRFQHVRACRTWYRQRNHIFFWLRKISGILPFLL